VPDVPACIEVSLERGYCVHTISDVEFWVDEVNRYEGKTWWELRPSMVMLPASSWKEIKSFIIKVCKERGDCQNGVGEWSNKLNRFDAHLGINP